MKNILITGASRGIGKAIVEKLQFDDKYHFIVVGRNKPDFLPTDSEKLLFVETDLSDLKSVQLSIDKIREHKYFREIDILINNAGIGHFAKIEDIELATWINVMNVNLNSAYLFMGAFLPGMRARDYGRIINISSDADHIGFAEAGAYCASKFGLLGLSEAVRLELIGKNVTITVISPARVDTHFNGKKPGDRPISLKAEDIAAQVAHILNQRDSCSIETIRIKSTLE